MRFYIACRYFFLLFSSIYAYFLQFKSEFGNKEFRIWAIVSSQSCFCWQYRASPSLAANNIINLILVLTIWWRPCVESSLVLLEEVFAMHSVFSWQNSVSLCPASFCTPSSNLLVPPGISCLPTFALQSPRMNRTSVLVLVLEGLLVLHRIFQLQLLQH